MSSLVDEKKRFDWATGCRSVAVFLMTISALITILSNAAIAQFNPYLARPRERPVSIRIATCAVSGGFAHLYTALENRLFDKYGFKMEPTRFNFSTALRMQRCRRWLAALT